MIKLPNALRGEAEGKKLFNYKVGHPVLDMLAMSCLRKKKHVILGNVDYTFSSTDNNCVSISIDFGKNVKIKDEEEYAGCAHLAAIKRMQQCPPKTIIDRERMVLSERDTSQKQFTALKSRSSFFSVLKFETGAVIVVGLQDPALTNLCVSKTVTDIADTLEYPIRVRNVSIVNTVSTFTRFHLDFVRMCEFFNRHCIAYIYNPETFPGMFFKLRVPAKKLQEGETLGQYYTKVAKMRDESSSLFDINEWFRVKTVLTFKVGKNTVLGECGGDDVSVISKLLFGLFHYFMDSNIKLSPSEARRIQDRYGIPSLEWLLYVDVLFHSHPYIKPSRDQVRLSMIGSNPISIDKTYYGNSPDSPLSANLLPTGKETARIVNAMMAQKLCGPLTIRKRVLTHCNEPRGWWRRNKKPDPFMLIRMGSSASMAKWWVEKDFKSEKDRLIDLCHEEIVKECEDGKLIPAAFMQNYTLTEKQERLARAMNGKRKNLGSEQGSSFFGSSRSKRIKLNHKKHAVNLARLETHITAYKFLSTHLVSGLAPKLAELFGTDVYSLLHLVKQLPKARGHLLSLDSEMLKNSSSVYKTPGDNYFSHLLDDNRSQKKNVTGMPLSQSKCEACRSSLRKGSFSVECGLCEACDEQSTLYVKNALSIIRNRKRHSEESDFSNNNNKRLKKCTPTDFIDSVFKFRDELTGTPKVGLQFKVNDILNTLSVGRSTEERPTANYRTSLHTETQNKSNLKRLLVEALKENGATDDEAQIFNRLFKNGKGLSTLCELAARGRDGGEKKN